MRMVSNNLIVRILDSGECERFHRPGGKNSLNVKTANYLQDLLVFIIAIYRDTDYNKSKTMFFSSHPRRTSTEMNKKIQIMIDNVELANVTEYNT